MRCCNMIHLSKLHIFQAIHKTLQNKSCATEQYKPYLLHVLYHLTLFKCLNLYFAVFVILLTMKPK